MNPTIIEGDRILVNKHVFGLRVPFTTWRLTQGENPQRGDIVVFDSPTTGTTLVKRVIGVPGDIIEMRAETLFINHQRVNYQAAALQEETDLLKAMREQDHILVTEALPGRRHAIMVLPERAARRDFAPMTVPSGQYFMMGDSRDNSEDSRYIGSVPRAAIVGRASEVVVSLNPEHAYLPRAARFWKALE